MLITLAAGLAATAMQVPAPERGVILDAARQPVVKRLGKPVKFLVRRLERQGDWAFLIAAMQDRSGRPISYRGTALASAEAEGMVSKDYVALLRVSGAGWRVVDQAVGPTDVAWADWAARHGAPRSLFP
jgi:hypothetical protein